MGFIKGLALACLSLLLFFSMVFFGLALTLNTTVLNADFITDQIEDLPVSTIVNQSLDDEDSFFITKFKVVFKDNIIKIIHPIDLVHYIFDLNERVITKQGTGISFKDLRENLRNT